MSKYFDKLLKINEGLDRELGEEPISSASTNFEAAIEKYSKEGLSDGDCLVKAFNDYLMSKEEYQDKSMDDISLAGFSRWLTTNPNSDEDLYLEDGDEDNISIPKDSLTDDQKKDILKDNGVDAATVDGMKSSDELDSAMDATLNNAAIKKESGYDDDKIQKVLRIDDDDLDIHAFVKMFDDKDIEFTDDEQQAMTYVWQREIDHDIRELCDKFHYDPSTVSVVEINQYDDDSKSWVALDPIHPGATTLD